MKKTFLQVLCYALLATMATAQTPVAAIGTPEIVGEGTVSSPDFEYNFTVTADQTMAFFSKALLPDWRRISIVYSTKQHGRWSAPMLAPFSGQYRDTDPFIVPGGQRLLFISDRPSKYTRTRGDYSIWFIDLPFTKTTVPQLLEGDFYEQVNSPLYPGMTTNGDLYFCGRDTSGKSAIFFVKNEQGHYGKAQKLSFSNPNIQDLDPVVAPDGSFLIFSSSARKGQGATDLFVSFKNGERWSEPVNLGNAINSPGNEGQAGLSADGTMLYFSSSRPKTVTDYSPRPGKISTNDLRKELYSPFNGLPNIWQVDIRQIRLLNR